MRENNRTFIHYFFDQEVRRSSKDAWVYSGAGLKMPNEIQNDEQAIAWAKARMKDLSNTRVFNIERQTSNYQHITDWEEK